MKYEITRISALQCSKINTALYAMIGFIYTLIGLFMVLFGGPSFQMAGVIYILMPIILGVIGFVGTLYFAAIYNWLTKRLGGFEFEMKTKE